MWSMETILNGGRNAVKNEKYFQLCQTTQMCGLPTFECQHNKNRYHIPVVEELLDELSRAWFFTSLDLRFTYHQIRMKPSDEAKTAFRTHHCHYEYRVFP